VLTILTSKLMLEFLFHRQFYINFSPDSLIGFRKNGQKMVV